MIDMVGKQFGRLTVIKSVGTDRHNSINWLCQCSCGNTKVIDGRSLRRGSTRSCGCYDREKHYTNPNRKTHGMCGTRIHRIWKAMKNRCYNKNGRDYKLWYGSHGIIMCDEWKNSFQAFYDWAMKNGYEEGLSIDRIDPYGNYEPNNCRWATAKEQAQNKRNSKKKEGD